MATHHRPRSDKSLLQPATDQLQEANSLEASSVAYEFMVMRYVGPDGRVVVKKLPVEIDHELVDITLAHLKE